MPSLLARLGQAAIPAAEARAGYMSGEREQTLTNNAQQRQSMLDKMNQMLGAAQIDETKSRGDYYKGLGNDNWAENSQGDFYNKRTGEIHRGSGRPPVPHGEEHFDPTKGPPDPTTGQPSGEVGLTFVGPDGQISWKKTRDATMIDRTRYSREPRDPSAPAPEPADVVQSRSYDRKKKAADDFVAGFLANHDASDLTADNLQVYAGRVLTSEERAALGRMRTPPAADRSFEIPPASGAPTSPKVVPSAAPGKTKPPVTPLPVKHEQTTEFEPVGTFARKARGENVAQDEVDKAALRQAHPEMNEDQITNLLGQLRGSRPPGPPE